MQVIIAGGTGFLGRAIARVLLADGHKVWALSRNPDKARPGSGELVQWDARTARGWGKLVEEADAIINLVGENIGGGRWTEERKQRIRDSRISAGQAIVSAVEQASHRPSVLVQASGIGHYGSTGDKVVTETAPAGSDFLAQVTVDWENSTRRVEELGVRRVVCRNALVLDKSEGVFPLVLLPFRLFGGGPLGSGQQWFPWIHRDDEVQGILYLLKDEGASGAYNMVAPDAVTNAQVGKAIARVMKRPYWFPAPAFAMRMVLGEMSTLVLDGQRAVPDRLLAAGYKFRFPTIDGALRDLLR
jgi:uncharacterized protein